MLNNFKKFLFILLAVSAVLTSCKKKPRPVYVPKTDFLTQGSDSYSTSTSFEAPVEQERIPQFTRSFSDSNFDTDIDDGYFVKNLKGKDSIGCYVKTGSGFSLKMYSRAGFESDEYYTGDFKEGDLGVLLYVYNFNDSEAKCSVWVRIFNLNTQKEGWVFYNQSFSEPNLLFTSKSFNVYREPVYINNINARGEMSLREMIPDTLSNRVFFSKDNSRFASIKENVIYFYVSSSEKIYREIQSNSQDFEFDESSQLVFSDDAQTAYLVNKKGELFKIDIENEKYEKVFTFSIKEINEFYLIDFLKISPDQKCLYFCAVDPSLFIKYVFAYEIELNKSSSFEYDSAYDYDRWDLENVVCTDRGATFTLFKKDYIQAAHIYPVYDGEEFDFKSEVKEYYDLKKEKLNFVKAKSESYICVKNRTDVFSVDVDSDSHESNSFAVSIDPYKENTYRETLKVIQNEDGTSDLISTYDVKNYILSIYSESFDLLFSVYIPYYENKIIWNGNTFYFLNYSETKEKYIMFAYTINLIKKDVTFPLSYRYNSDIEKLCSKVFLICNDGDYNLYATFSPQGMYSLYSVGKESGSFDIIRGEYEFVDYDNVKLYQAFESGDYILNPEATEEQFYNLPLFGNDEVWKTVNITLFYNEDSGLCDYLAK